MDAQRFVEELMTAVPEAFTAQDVDDFREEPLTYVALSHARTWLEENALQILGPPRRAMVDAQHLGVFQRFWDFVETQASTTPGDRELETLLQIECFEGVGWVEDVSEFLGPRTRELLADAQRWLADYNGQVGRWPEPSDQRRRRA